MIEDIAEIWDEFKHEVMPKVREAIRAHIAEYPEEFKTQSRIEYLKSRMENIILKTFYLMGDYERLSKGDDIDSRLFVGEQIVGAMKTAVKLQDEITRLRKPKDGDNGITEDVIKHAREYPFDQLIKMDRNKMAVCPFHEDKAPSFSVKNNYGFCFGCHWKGNPIDFVMQKDGLSFPEAVRTLQ